MRFTTAISRRAVFRVAVLSALVGSAFALVACGEIVEQFVAGAIAAETAMDAMGATWRRASLAKSNRPTSPQNTTLRPHCRRGCRVPGLLGNSVVFTHS